MLMASHGHRRPRHDLPARRLATFPSRLRLLRGGVLEQPVIAYETWGAAERGARQRRADLHRHVAVGPRRVLARGPDAGLVGVDDRRGRPIDTRRFFVVCVNSLGSRFGSSGPASIDPRTGRPYRLTFPVAVEDIAAPAARCCAPRHRARRVRGRPSLGGMTALAFAALFPGEVDNLVTISGAARAAVRDCAALAAAGDDPQRSRLARRQLRARARPAHRHAARAQARHDHLPLGARSGSSASGASACPRPPDSPATSARLRGRGLSRAPGARFTGQFDANCYLYLSRAIDLFDVAEHGGGRSPRRSPASRSTRARHRRRDGLPVPDRPAARARRPPAGRRGASVEFHAFPSLQGHDAFLVDMARFQPAIGDS